MAQNDNHYCHSERSEEFQTNGMRFLHLYLFGTTPDLMMSMFSVRADGSASLNLLGWIVMLAPLIIVFVMSYGMEKMKASTMIILYIVYSILMGMSLGFIFLAYTGASITKTFVITAGMFGLMAFLGYTTKTDLTRCGTRQE